MRDFGQFLADRRSQMLELGVEHLQVVLISVLLCSAIGIGLGVATYARPRARAFALAVAGAILTVPSFALFVLFLGPLGIGTAPVVAALTLYGVLPVLRNTVVGLREVDPALVEAARGMGMSSRQMLIRVRFPLAWPVIITGMRLATLLLVGIATIGAVVAGPGYGQLIFDGLARVGSPVATDLVLAGMLGVMAVAVALDAAFAGLVRLTTPRGLR